VLLATIVSVAPFGHRPRPGTGGAFLVLPVAVTVILGLAVTCFLKGRVLFGVIGVFIPVVAFVGAVRLAHPASLWARRRYDAKRLDEARMRFDPARRAGRWQRRLSDLVAGAPTPEDDS
jgi:hypothetical protein